MPTQQKQKHKTPLTIQAWRTARALSLDELASLTNINKANMSMIERNIANPTVATLEKIAAALDCNVWDLFQSPPSLHH